MTTSADLLRALTAIDEARAVLRQKLTDYDHLKQRLLDEQRGLAVEEERPAARPPTANYRIANRP